MPGNKLVSLPEAVAGLVKDGQLIATTGEMDAAPMAIAKEMVRAGKRELRIVGLPGSGIAWDLLIGAGCVAEAQVCHISLGGFGPAPNFKRYVEGGRLKVNDNT